MTAVGDRVVLNDDVLFGPVRLLTVKRVCKNGNVHAYATTETDGCPGSVRVIVGIEDVSPEPEDWPAAKRAFMRRLAAS